MTSTITYILPDVLQRVIVYILPDGRKVGVPYDVCRAASTIDFTLADGRIVLAVIQKGQR